MSCFYWSKHPVVKTQNTNYTMWWGDDIFQANTFYLKYTILNLKPDKANTFYLKVHNTEPKTRPFFNLQITLFI